MKLAKKLDFAEGDCSGLDGQITVVNEYSYKQRNDAHLEQDSLQLESNSRQF